MQWFEPSLDKMGPIQVQHPSALNLLDFLSSEPPSHLQRLFIHFPFLRRLPAGLIGIGVRPERVTSPERTEAAL